MLQLYFYENTLPGTTGHNIVKDGTIQSRQDAKVSFQISKRGKEWWSEQIEWAKNL